MASTLIMLLLGLILHLTTSTTGLQLQLIHRDSPSSPFHNKNLTTLQKLHLDLESSKIAANMIGNNGTSTNPPLSPQMLEYMHPLYILELGIGTPGDIRRFQFDISYSLTWIHCRPCKPCPINLNRLFTPVFSHSYANILKKDEICSLLSPFIGNRAPYCRYFMKYPQKDAHIEGNLAREVLHIMSQTLSASTNEPEWIEIKSFVFGCTLSSTIKTLAGIDGVFGLGRKEISLLHQEVQLTNLRFSYCLVQSHLQLPSFLGFGSSARILPGYKRTPISPETDTYGRYYVNLEGLSIEDKSRSLKIDRRAFARMMNEGGRGGVVMSTTSTVTYLVRISYRSVRDFMVLHARRHRLKGSPAIGELDVCYEKGSGMDYQMPFITLHFEGGVDLVVEPNEVFVFEGRRFCLNILPNKEVISIIGTRLQQNVRFVFDLQTKNMYFHRENCGQVSHAG